MKQPVCLHRASATPTPGAGVLAPHATTLPPDLLKDAPKRLGYVALLYGVGYLVAYFGSYFIDPRMPLNAFLRSFQTAVAIVAVLLGLSIFLVSRYARIRPELLLDFALVFEVVGAIGLAVPEVWGVFPEASSHGTWMDMTAGAEGLFGVPWECVWILVFPLIAPNTPGKVLLAALAAASAAPVTLLLSKSVGATHPSVPVPDIFMYYLFTTYLCAGIAFLITRGILKFGRRLAKAREIGSYQLTERLGVGGMGEVWLARHRMLARPAAIKLVRPERLGRDGATRRSALLRFEREAQATAALRSYHTIELYDFGVSEDGAFFYVMELLDGLNLNDLVKQYGPVPAGRAIHLLRQACHSLGEAHDRGMIHRDIKPANVFVCRLGPELDFVKVLDFGLVKSHEDAQPGATELTAQGAVAGTPAFIAPEMAAGTEVDGRADLYSLGCVGYWLLTGQPVFEGDTPLSTILQHVQDEPPPLSTRTEIEVPEQLERVILSCLEKKPADRPQSADELANRLAACGRNGDWSRDRAEEWWLLHRPEAAVWEGPQP
jgi:serine/threonine-protein kinase